MITWNIGDFGFDMVLSGQVPGTIHDGAARQRGRDTRRRGAARRSICGRSIPAAAPCSMRLSAHSILRPDALSHSREVLRRYGNMSSATVMFVIERLLASAQRGLRGCAMSFGPGLTAETMLFRAGG